MSISTKDIEELGESVSSTMGTKEKMYHRKHSSL